jgi:hypothetical protein
MVPTILAGVLLGVLVATRVMAEFYSLFLKGGEKARE